MEMHYCKHGVGGNGGGCLQCRAEKAEAELAKLRALTESAWGIIANSNGGNWMAEDPTWRLAAEQWRDLYLALLGDVTAGRGEY